MGRKLTSTYFVWPCQYTWNQQKGGERERLKMKPCPQAAGCGESCEEEKPSFLVFLLPVVSFLVFLEHLPPLLVPSLPSAMEFPGS